MTTFEIISLILLWVIVGFWISYKRNWYKDFGYEEDGQGFCIGLNIIFAPIVLVITLCSRLFYEPWEQN
jgi:hypothetical protein